MDECMDSWRVNDFLFQTKKAVSMNAADKMVDFKGGRKKRNGVKRRSKVEKYIPIRDAERDGGHEGANKREKKLRWRDVAAERQP